MTIASHSCKILLVTMFSLAATYAVAQAADARRQAVMSHVRALETSVQQPLADVLAAFDASHFSAGFIGRTEAGKRRALLAAVRESVASAQGILLDEDAAGVHLRLMAPDGPVRVTLRVAATAPFRIEQLTIGPDDTPVPELAWESLTAHFDARAADGWSGVVYAVRDGEVVVDGAWGKADRARGTAVTQDTVFGIGSVPIDFTVAAVLLLDQRGRLQLDDPIHRHLGGVPEDKRGMTIRHLIEGRSGLPDFHDRPGDWDADLAWIDRETAVRRILEQPLRFAPGEGEAHSHSAYGLAAAIVERVSGQSYGSFLADEFFVPAGMTRTGFYGETGELELDDFAVGHGPSSVGLPNIPPNWGPTSWLVMGSGGMYSTLPDLRRFYALVRSDRVLAERHAQRFRGVRVGAAGSDRGFYVFQAADGRGNEVLMLMNGEGRSPEIRTLSRSLETLVMSGAAAD